MNGFWKKKVPAFLLALVMTAGMMPAALAVHEGEHNFGDNYFNDTESHWQQCPEPDCGATSGKEPHTKSQAVILSDASC